MIGKIEKIGKIPVTILGATGCVGQQFVKLLSDHPRFEITALCASDRSVGLTYRDAINRTTSFTLPDSIARMKIRPCSPDIDSPFVFSGLDSSVAERIEEEFARSGAVVVSNSSPHRMNPRIPLLIGEINPDHLSLLTGQSYSEGKIITNPNCSVIGLTLALKPLMDRFGLEAVHVVTLQALSGAGYPGVASLDICDNVIPYIKGEEEKVEREPLKILGEYDSISGNIREADFKISAHCNRVAVSDGHLACVSVKFKKKPRSEEILEAWDQFSALPQQLNLPTAPLRPLHYFEESSYPQPRLHRMLDKEMGVSIGRLRKCSLFDYKFCLLSHNRVRGAAGTAVLNAELFLALS